MCTVVRVTASKNSRSWLMTSMVPSYFCSQASSHTKASKSKWLVGSSSSIRSEGHIKARASCKRMRQPPLKLFTGCSNSESLKPNPKIRAWARAGAS